MVCIPIAGPWVVGPDCDGHCPSPGFVAAHVSPPPRRRRPRRRAQPAGDRRELPGPARQSGQPRHHHIALGDVPRRVRRHVAARADLQAVCRLHARPGRRITGSDRGHRVRAGHPDDLPREDHESTAGKCLREHGLSRRRASRRRLARVRVLHEDSAGREPRLQRQGRAVGSRRQGRRRCRGDAELGGVRAVVQVQALCARTR